ncbi:MAG: Amuc_1100 family pilus-like protein [Verrucomicrobiota bacterium]
MKTKLTTFEWIIVGTMILVFVLGGVSAFILSGKVQDKKTELDADTQSIISISKHEHYPNAQNMEQIKENSKQVEGFMISLKPILQPSENQLQDVKEVEAVDFKQQLSTTADSLRALAKAQSVIIPVDFYFGFSRYQKQNPKKKDTLILGKQLLGIEKLIANLISYGPQKIESVSRSFEEDGEIKKGSLDPEQLKFSSFTHPEGFYTTYPLEVEFVGTPATLQQFLNGIAKLPYLYVVRSCYSTSLKPVPPRLDELQRQYAAGTAPQGTKLPPLVPVLGEEKIKFKVRVDLVEWLGVSEKNKSAEKKS